MSRSLSFSFGAVGLALLSACSDSTGGEPSGSDLDPRTRRFVVDNTASIADLTPTVLGAPLVTESELGPALCFDGADDGLVFASNPLAGMSEFTVEVSFRPDADGPAEQRFVHLQEDPAENRALIETRVTSTGFYLDTFLRSGAAELTLADAAALHPTGAWYWAALSYDGSEMRHYVDGVEEVSGPVTFAPLGPGRMSLGVRLNQVHWFKGCIRELRVTDRALPKSELATTK